MQWLYSEPPYLNVLEEQLLIRFAVPLPDNLPDQHNYAWIRLVLGCYCRHVILPRSPDFCNIKLTLAFLQGFLHPRLHGLELYGS